MFFEREVIILFWLLLAGAGSVVGVVAIWAGLGRTFWFWRIAVLGAVLSLTLVMSAYDLLLIFTVQSVVVMVPLMAFRIFRRGKEDEDDDARRIQFTIRDLLLLTVVVAAVCAVVVSMPPSKWELWGEFLGLWKPFAPPPALRLIGTALVIVGLIFGLFTLAAAGIALVPLSLRLRLILLVVCFPAVLMTGWLMLLRASDYFARGPTERPQVHRAAKAALALLTLIVLVPLSTIYWNIALPPRAPPEVVLPDPNGYDELAAAAGALENVLVPDADIAAAGEFKPFVMKYEHVLQKARIGLGRDCRVPLRYDPSDLPEILATRQLAWAFAAEGKLAEMEGRTNDAVEAYLDVIRMGRASERGGLILHTVLGWAWERIGMARLAELRHSLTTGQCRELIATLESLNTDREPLEIVAARDRLWEKHAYGWVYRLTMLLQWITGNDTRRSRVEIGGNWRQAYFRLLITDLAIRCYEADHGKQPGALADLVPEYLAEVPEDPFSGRPLVYRPDPAGYLLYSVGRDETDDGGASDSFGGGLAGGDIVLDEPDEQPEPIDDESLWE